METFFRLVNLVSDQSYNSSRTSSSSRSSRQTQTHHQNHHHYVLHQEECSNNPYMDEDDFSSSSSKHFSPYHHHLPSSTTPPAATHALDPSQFSFSPDLNLDIGSSTSSGKWASDIIIQCARAIAEKNSSHVQQLMWMLNELSSPYGDAEQKLAAYFLQGLFCRMTDSGDRCRRTLLLASEKTCSFESTRKTILKFQEVSPWATFGHVACNGAILEAFEGESKLHIVDISTTYCTQWPTLLESLATRSDDTPHLRLTSVVGPKFSGAGVAMNKLMREIGNRMEKFARLMGVPFKFSVVHHAGDLSELNFDELGIEEDEAVAVNCIGTLHSSGVSGSRREALVSSLRRIHPKIVTIVEDEADLDVGVDGPDFVRGVQECLRWFSIYLESLDESFPRASNERLMLERAAGRSLVDLLSCPPAESVERRESAARWSRRMRTAGFAPAQFSDDVTDDVRALLRRYRDGWSMSPGTADAGLFLAWKEQPVVWACAWKP